MTIRKRFGGLEHSLEISVAPQVMSIRAAEAVK